MEEMTTLMLPDKDLNATTMSTSSKPGLLTISGEIRNEIWRMLLTTSCAFKGPTSEGDREAHYELQPAILRVNRQIYNETRGILREGNMWILLCIATPKKPVCYVDETAHLPVVSRSILRRVLIEIGNCYLGMESHALNVVLYPEYTCVEGNYDCHTMIMGPESLPYLLQLLFAILYIDRSIEKPPRTRMEMYVGHSARVAPSRLQKEILEPFSAARRFKFIFVMGNVDKDFAHSLMVEMRSPWKTTVKLLEFSNAYLEKGDAAATAGLTKAASFHYEQGSHFTFFAGQSYIDRLHVQGANVYHPICTASMLDAFDIRLAKVLLKLRCYADVQRLAASALSTQDKDRPTTNEKVQLVLCCALASLGLGEDTRFIQITSGLFEGICHPAVFPKGSGVKGLLVACQVFRDTLSIVKNKDAMIRELDGLVAYCKEGEKDSLRRINTEDGLPDRKEIEFPVVQDWSPVAARYERRRKTRARNKSVLDRFR